MKRLLFAVFLLMMLPAAVQAKDRALCKILKNYQPSQNTEVRPGVSIRGRNIPSADLLGKDPAIVGEIVKIPLSVNLARRFGLSNFKQQELNAPLGILEVNVRNGKVRIDGRDVTSRAMALCGDQKKNKLVPSKSRIRLNDRVQTLPGTIIIQQDPILE